VENTLKLFTPRKEKEETLGPGPRKFKAQDQVNSEARTRRVAVAGKKLPGNLGKTGCLPARLT
jgi:hypothetical protein